jgi:thymidylate synthase (FAD)
MSKHVVNVEEIKEKAWTEPQLHLGEKPEFSFVYADSMKVKLLYPLDEELQFDRWIDTMYQPFIATWTNKYLDLSKVPFEAKLVTVRKMIEKNAATVPLEAITMTFAVEGVSRAITHQIVRHRQMGFGQESFRITDARHHNVRITPTIASSAYGQKYIDIIKEVKDLYAKMIDSGIPIEQARNILPIGSITYITITGTLRSWIDVWRARGSEGAQDEHQILTDLELAEFKEKLPQLYDLIKVRIGK